MVPFLLKIMQHIHGAGWDPPQGSDGMEEELTLLLSIIYQQSWLTGEVPVDRWFTNATSTYVKGWKEDVGNDSLTMVPGEVVLQIIVSVARYRTTRGSVPASTGS